GGGAGDEFRRAHKKAGDDLRAEEKAAAEALNRRVNERLLKERDRLVPGIGFSLDPHYDFAALAKDFAKHEPLLRSLAERKPPLVDERLIPDVIIGFDRQKILPFLELKDDLRRKLELAAPRVGLFPPKDFIQAEKLERALGDIELQHMYQFARYDGKLKGTEV